MKNNAPTALSAQSNLIDLKRNFFLEFKVIHFFLFTPKQVARMNAFKTLQWVDQYCSPTEMSILLVQIHPKT